ncbi:tripartite tricarboxylate transporter substrate binding protein [Siccirubricoccus sp. KC 17139]|uniref:Tripartite tricarboxylate transporter substrate binding protein n=1 Tax=Siccirubricoccus soli TaxID=2899147 RepID=A0ABT1D9B5_9PROT|nr:tripartite tricarboxylate transporter substrate binding protein [Siccirubricoccus soli]MCO6418503.1 tripartite tricarboxylate transporter substrate binding protein [Siccirubricoccus soli]MCP2684638.1 tripartite tricarboxylate transporter substrate binding protein [Siccirubricoccus soli]
MRRRSIIGLGAAATSALLRPARAQAEFPSRAVTMLVAFPPGGQGDVVARPVAAGLERLWRVPVPVVNRAGAAGEIGYAAVARAAPDGYTLLMGLSSLAVLPEAARLFGRTPAYEVDQLTPIALFTADPTLLAVPANAPWRTLEEFIADAKARPGAIPYSSSGLYSALHVPMAMLTSAAGIDLLHVPFQGGGPAMTAIVSGQVQALASGPGPLTPHVRDGRLRVLASWGARRIPGFEEVPTLRERGFPEAEFYIWAGAFAPAGTPPAVLARLREGMAQAARDPEVQKALAASGNNLGYLDGEAFAEFFQADAARLRRAVQRIGKVE